jgi:hypothetical protein
LRATLSQKLTSHEIAGKAIFHRAKDVLQVMSRAGFVDLDSVSNLVPTVERYQNTIPESAEFQRNSSFTLGTAQGLNILGLPFKPARKCICLKSVLAVRQQHKSVVKIATLTPKYRVKNNFT